MRTRRNHFKPKRRSKLAAWLKLISIITVLQIGSLWLVDRFLQPPELPASAQTSDQSGTLDNQEHLVAPTDAVRSALQPNGQNLAYTTQDGKLVIIDSTGIVHEEEAGNVTYMSWLGDSTTLFYVVQGNNTAAYLLPLHNAKPVQLKRWTGDERKVTNTYFSPFLEVLYVEVQNGNYNEYYRYEAIHGMKKLPLPKVDITHVEYDDKKDILEFRTSSGETWKYENQKLYRPDGSVERDGESDSRSTRHSRSLK